MTNDPSCFAYSVPWPGRGGNAMISDHVARNERCPHLALGDLTAAAPDTAGQAQREGKCL